MTWSPASWRTTRRPSSPSCSGGIACIVGVLVLDEVAPDVLASGEDLAVVERESTYDGRWSRSASCPQAASIERPRVLRTVAFTPQFEQSFSEIVHALPPTNRARDSPASG